MNLLLCFTISPSLLRQAVGTTCLPWTLRCYLSSVVIPRLSGPTWNIWLPWNKLRKVGQGIISVFHSHVSSSIALPLHSILLFSFLVDRNHPIIAQHHPQLLRGWWALIFYHSAFMPSYKTVIFICLVYAYIMYPGYDEKTFHCSPCAYSFFW